MIGSPSIFGILSGVFDRGSLGHALLLVTPPGARLPMLESDFASFRALLMCPERKTGETAACGKCASCRLLLSQSEEVPAHPDLVRLVSPEGKAYSVEDIRGLLEQFSLSRSLGENRVAWIEEADLLAGNQNAAANALLKILEEPRPNSYLVLVTARPEALLATIRSRCQIFRLPRPPSSDTLSIAEEECLRDWKGLLAWLNDGAPSGRGPYPLPADEESFWKDREGALAEMDRLFQALWAALRPAWPRFDREAGLRVLDVFSRLEEALAAVRGNAAGPLQWLSFRMDARLDP